MISIHALREEGDTYSRATPHTSRYFYPRPPRGGRLALCLAILPRLVISIHALREEGDSRLLRSYLAFCLFLSTPSARRATHEAFQDVQQGLDFYPRPPRGGRPMRWDPSTRRYKISIHALREEGDLMDNASKCIANDFYPRPPRGGRHPKRGAERRIP